MNSSYYVYCYHCGKSKDSSEEQLQSLGYGDWVYCSCGEKINLRLTKQDYRKFKLRKIKEKMV